MRLLKYNDLIRALPYKEHAFKIQRKNWEKYKDNKLFKAFLNEACSNSTSKFISFSRADLFKSVRNNHSIDALFSIIMWGYPKGIQIKRPLGPLLKNVVVLEKHFSGTKNINTEEFLGICKKIKGTGMGISTLTKCLYFFKIKINGLKCVILDDRIIKIIYAGEFEELASLKQISNKNMLYIKYLELLNDLSKKNKYQIDRLEYFLYSFGNNLKA